MHKVECIDGHELPMFKCNFQIFRINTGQLCDKMYKNLSFSHGSILVGMLELDELLLKVLTVAVDTMLLFPYGKKENRWKKYAHMNLNFGSN